ncbi:MAG: zinc metallopeptidase [Clostridia bacterium]|nr:zinc metallopeptidase [Clostridia bacterium]
MFFGVFWWSYLLIIPGLLLSAYAQMKVQRTYAAFASVRARSGWTAEGLAAKFLRDNGCNVRIQPIAGNLTDNYKPGNKILSLSQSTYGRSSISALGIAAHEVGHAVQDRKNYIPLKFRAVLVPLVNLGSGLAIPLALVGVLFDLFLELSNLATFFLIAAIVAYSLATVFSLVTLPGELDASRRAMKMLRTSGALDSEELAGAKKVLTAAAMTYVASLFTSLLYLLRFILILSRFTRRR